MIDLRPGDGVFYYGTPTSPNDPPPLVPAVVDKLLPDDRVLLADGTAIAIDKLMPLF